MRNKAVACIGAIAACAMMLAGVPSTAMADETSELNPTYTYNAVNGMTFEKVSHADHAFSRPMAWSTTPATAPSPPTPPA